MAGGDGVKVPSLAGNEPPRGIEFRVYLVVSGDGVVPCTRCKNQVNGESMNSGFDLLVFRDIFVQLLRARCLS